jgi:hypothetical protein
VSRRLDKSGSTSQNRNCQKPRETADLLQGPEHQKPKSKLAHCLLESNKRRHSRKNVASVLENTAVSIMMVHFFTDRLARVDLVFILHLKSLISVFDSTRMAPYSRTLRCMTDESRNLPVQP